MIRYFVGRDMAGSGQAAYPFQTNREGEHLESIKINNRVFAEFDSMEKAEIFAAGYNAALREIESMRDFNEIYLVGEEEGDKYYLIEDYYKYVRLEKAEKVDKKLEYYCNGRKTIVYANDPEKAMKELEKMNVVKHHHTFHAYYIPETGDFISSSLAEKEYGLYPGAIRQAIFKGRIKKSECMKIANAWFVDRAAVERAFKLKEDLE